ncbi:heme exporter protein A [Deinobacterium chartae]|uniref:Heme exporter protein A n=1 Tax=Deinobacterium chartae TaxID=521158 RepID=A0A841HXC8_9DEIO|nr:heme ABC exporter ATP-binding protein CcmA [Deinobacterium chartae]MBB6098181.1 heme exporter protein A [Deinobacterium chartae]
MTGPAREYAVQLAGVVRRFGHSYVLRGVNLDLELGSALVIYGANGAGKTTLLRVIAGSLSPTRGEGRVFGYDLHDRPAVRAHVHLMTHEQGLYSELTVRENLEFSLAMHGLTRSTSGERLRTALARVGLERAAEKPVRELSAGMRKRAALARMSLLPSPLVLIDEPFANLDAAGRELALALLLEAREAGRTLMIASHEPELSERIATRSVVLEDGLLREAVGA